MKTKPVLGILAVGLVVAIATIISHRGGGGTEGVQATGDEHPPTSSAPAPQYTRQKTLATQPASAPAITVTASEPAALDGVAVRHKDYVQQETPDSPSSESQPADESAGAIAATQPADSAAELTPTTRPVVSIRPSAFETERRQIQAIIETDQTTPRSDLLVMYSRTAAGSGKFRPAAAACAMFLDEFGDSHPLTAQIAVRMGDCLAPLDMNNIEIADGQGGPRFRPHWRGTRKPTTEQLYQAVAAYERAVEISKDENQQAEALLKLGWVYRALNDWKTSTEVWDRCAQQASHLRGGQEAMFLAAENLTFAGQNQAAAERLHQLAKLSERPERAQVVRRQAEALDRAAWRDAAMQAWIDHPVESLKAELQTRGEAVWPAVYREVSLWMRRGGHHHALMAIARRALRQPRGNSDVQVVAMEDLLTGLEHTISDPQTRKAAQAAVLGEVMVDLAGEWRIQTGLRRAALLVECGDVQRARDQLDQVQQDSGDSDTWRPVVAEAKIKVDLAEGKHSSARSRFTELRAAYPDYTLAEDLMRQLSNSRQGGR